ncbi:MAG: hypothetical protein PHR30_18020 [Gallionellaceae bacterium]|nr:hypothetical protein [Gallionellaceae bacterium]MDD5367239.1 hypothetical protein [Gallionellaceae bacterium]
MTALLPPWPLGRLFRDGFMVALLNPKTTVFFTALTGSRSGR